MSDLSNEITGIVRRISKEMNELPTLPEGLHYELDFEENAEGGYDALFVVKEKPPRFDPEGLY